MVERSAGMVKVGMMVTEARMTRGRERSFIIPVTRGLLVS
jgi:hypothetical protein